MSFLVRKAHGRLVILHRNLGDFGVSGGGHGAGRIERLSMRSWQLGICGITGVSRTESLTHIPNSRSLELSLFSLAKQRGPLQWIYATAASIGVRVAMRESNSTRCGFPEEAPSGKG